MENSNLQADIDLAAGQRIFIFDAEKEPIEIYLSSFGKKEVLCGRNTAGDIVLSSKISSMNHARFIFENDRWNLYDLDSILGILYDGNNVDGVIVTEDDFVRIDNKNKTIKDGVLILFANRKYAPRWTRFSISDEGETELQNLDATLEGAAILHNGSDFEFVIPVGQSITINNDIISGRYKLSEKDVIATPECRLVFTSSALYYNKIKDRPLPKNIPVLDLAMIEQDEKDNADILADEPSDFEKEPLAEESSYVPTEQSSFSNIASGLASTKVKPVQNNTYRAQTDYVSNGYSCGNNKSTHCKNPFWSKLKGFFISKLGYYAMVAVFAYVLWGITINSLNSDGAVALIIMLCCTYFGWKTLSRIQPEAFSWLTGIAWLIYIWTKFSVSVFIGVVVAPFRLAKRITCLINDKL